MKAYNIELESTTPIIFSRKLELIDFPKLEREQADAYDLRIWPEKAHYNEVGSVIVPSVYFKRAMEECAQYTGQQIPGKGKATYTKHFMSGVQVLGLGIDTGIKKADVKSVAISCNSDGKRGSGSRVTRRFPTLPTWKGFIQVLVVDEIITESVLRDHLEKAGMFIGIGSFRLRKGNSSGGFKVVSVKETKI